MALIESRNKGCAVLCQQTVTGTHNGIQRATSASFTQSNTTPDFTALRVGVTVKSWTTPGSIPLVRHGAMINGVFKAATRSESKYEAQQGNDTLCCVYDTSLLKRA